MAEPSLALILSMSQQALDEMIALRRTTTDLRVLMEAVADKLTNLERYMTSERRLGDEV